MTKHTAKRKRPTRNRRHRKRRGVYGRRKADFWQSLGKASGVVASGTMAVLGQAELIGEPWRHYVTVAGIAALGVAAYLVGPEHLKVIYRKLKGLK